MQEGLTNALKHAKGAHAEVLVRYIDSSVELEIADDGPGAPTGTALGTASSACASASRSTAARSRPARGAGGGFVLRAQLPVEATRMIRILLVDDQALVRAGFRMILDAEPDIEVVGEAADGREAVDQVRDAAPRRRADGHPHAGARRPRGDAAHPRGSPDDGAPKILMLTTFDLDEYVYEALRAGASGFLLKDTPPEQLVARDPRDRRGRGAALAVGHAPRDRGVRDAATGPKPQAQFPRLQDLTARELEVLKLIARGLSNAEIAKELFVSETTVKTHVARILMKLGLRDRVQAVVLAYEAGVVPPGDNTADSD